MCSCRPPSRWPPRATTRDGYGSDALTQPVSTTAKVHPLATASLVLSALGFFPLVIIGGLVGSAAGAAAGIAIRRDPTRWRGASRADAAVAVGLVSGVLVLAVFGLVRADDWGWAPLVATVAYGAVVVGLAAAGRRGARSGVVAAGAGAAGVLAALLLVVGLVLLLVALFRLMIQGVFEG